MSYNKSIQRIAIVGTGTIGASWTAHYLARGFDVVATDPGPDAEAKVRKYVDDAWGLLEANGLVPPARRATVSASPRIRAMHWRRPTSFRKTRLSARISRSSCTRSWTMPRLRIRSSRRVHREYR